MDLAYEFPNLASQSVTLHGFKALIEALPYPIIAQVLNLQAKVGLNSILSLYFLDRVHEDCDPLILRICPINIQFVDGLVEEVVLN